MIDFRIKKGLADDIFINGRPNPRLIIEKGCWYLCIDTAELFLGITELDENKNPVIDEITGEEVLTLKQINGNHTTDTNRPVQSPSMGVMPNSGIIGAYTDEETGERYVIFTDGSELAFGTVVGTPGKDGLTVAVKIGDTTYEHIDGVIELPEIDLSNYATQASIPTKISDLENDSNFITISDIPKVDLSEYVKESELPIVPTNVSAFTNDAGYLTAIPDEYITEAELRAKNYLTEHQSLANYATKTFVENTVAENQPNLSKYALKTDIPDVSEFITSIPTQYITESELEAKGYLTEHQSLAGYATENYVENAISNIVIPEPEKVDLSNYYTKSEVDSAIAANEVDLSGYAKTEDIPDVSAFITAIPDEYVTESDLTSRGYLTEHQDLSEYAKKSELFSKSYNDLTDTPAIPSIEGLASETYVDEAIANIDIPDIDLSGYALKSDVEVKADEIPFSTNRYVTNAIGAFTAGESVRGLTIAELFAKLLGLTDVPQGVVEDIITNEYGLYQFNDSLEVEHIEYTRTIFETAEEYAAAPTESTFYQYTYTNNEGEEVTESGYQHYTLAQDFIYYMVMLPSTLIIGENVKVQAWSPSKNMWMDSITVLESDLEVIAANFADAGLEMPAIPDGYTMWVDFSNTNPGNKVRYIIIE